MPGYEGIKMKTGPTALVLILEDSFIFEGSEGAFIFEGSEGDRSESTRPQRIVERFCCRANIPRHNRLTPRWDRKGVGADKGRWREGGGM